MFKKIALIKVLILILGVHGVLHNRRQEQIIKQLSGMGL